MTIEFMLSNSSDNIDTYSLRASASTLPKAIKEAYTYEFFYENQLKTLKYIWVNILTTFL